MQKKISKLRCGFYYDLLSIDEQVLYKRIGVAVSEMDNEVFLWNCNQKMLGKVLLAIKYDNAELFYWESEKSILSGNTLALTYRFGNREEVLKVLEEIRMERTKLILKGCEDKTDSAKDLLLKIYNDMKETVLLGEQEAMRSECSKWIYDIEGVFIKQKATCLGISLGINYICEQLRIPSILITGTFMLGDKSISHGWNLIDIEDGYFHYDLTKEIELGLKDCNRYFMISSDRLKDRTWSEKIYTLV